MPDQSGQQPGGDQPRDPWAAPEQRPSLDKPAQPAGPPPQSPPGAPPAGGSVHDQPTVLGTPGPVPPPPPAPGTYGHPGQSSGQVPPPAGPPAGPPPYPGGSAAGAPPYPQGPGYGYPQYPAGGPAPYGGPGWAGQAPPSNGMGTAAMVLGIVSVVGICLYGITGLITGVLAIVFAVKGRRKADNGEATNRSAATAGLILGWIGAVLGFLAIVGIVVAIIVGVHESHDSTPLPDDDPFATSLVIEH
ncbi:DUF4190 domain-containing protein [Streptomyces sp. DW26H14]|uniref:DUF4190 domain-containing protein n=1 Tax=Streptomyces sp. DW26H14 TaxID=3435395 RepID=UPI00403E2B1B